MLTVHAAKGLEFIAVHLPALGEGKFSARNSGGGTKLPSGILKPEMLGWGAEEEQCLFFVALSRACDVLNIYRAKQYENKPTEPSNLLELITEVLPPAQEAVKRPKTLLAIKEELSQRQPQLNFEQQALKDYLDCPLKYQYRHELKIPYFPPESPISKARLCVYKVWDKINQRIKNHFSVDREFINQTFEEVWNEQGPTNHPYAPEYRQEALAMINWTLKIHPPNIDVLTRPIWTVKLGDAEITLYPDYIKLVKENQQTILVVEKLNFGESPRKQIDEIIYALYEEAALQNRSDSNVRTEIKASIMTNQVTLPIPVSLALKDKGIQSYQNAIKGINNGSFTVRETKLCPLCPYYFICPAEHR